jgi:hypothetical protein
MKKHKKKKQKGTYPTPKNCIRRKPEDWQTIEKI